MSRLDQALDFLDLEAWLSDYCEIKKASKDEIQLSPCPRCGQEKYKLYVNTSSFRFICFICNFGKGISDVCLLMSEVSGRNINDIRLELISMVVPTPPPSQFEGKLAETLNKVLVVNTTTEILPVTLPGNMFDSGLTSNTVLNYAKVRGITDTFIEKYKLRVSNKLRNYPGPFLMFPIFYKDVPVAWQGRKIVDVSPKYVSSDTIADWLWPVDQLVDGVVLVEGVFDALGLLSIGVPALSTFGKKISKKQINLLYNSGIRNIVLGWDVDALQDIEKAAKQLSTSFRVKLVDFSSIKAGFKVDPGELLKHPGLESVFKDCLDNTIKVGSDEFYNWQLQLKLQ